MSWEIKEIIPTVSDILIARSTTRKKPVHKTKSATVAKKQEHAATNETEDHNADSTQGFDTQDLTG